MPSNQDAFEVYIPELMFDEETMTDYGRLVNEEGLAFINIDTIYYIKGMEAEEVRTSLISHDGYNPYIIVLPR